jgi:peptidoglycan-N-acetylglucosamine deacetylase
LANFRAANDAGPSPFWGEAGQSLPADLPSLKALAFRADSQMPAALLPWRDAAKRFYADYLYEQLRLAALFNKVSSEIFTYSPKEIQGDGFPDKSFLLTFDDGPTAPGGGTDALIAWLRQNRLDGTFFMLGGNLRHRLEKQSAGDLQGIYKGMCTASHGLEHKSHAKWDQWRASIAGTQALLDSVFTDNRARTRYFRPPYGQRTRDAQALLDSLGIKMMLWNLDSQDWNAKITAAQAADRIASLMLLWRRGILLFHDVHEKALAALPVVTKGVAGSGVVWKGCAED